MPVKKKKTILKGKAAVKNKSVYHAASLVKSKPLYIAVLTGWLLYFGITMMTPNTNSSSLRISNESLYLIRMTVALPYLLVWMAAAYSFVRIKRYAIAIRPSIESNAFNNIANAILLLAGSLILASVISAVKNFSMNIEESRPVLTILTNYAYVIPYLFAFIALFKGVKSLVSLQPLAKIPVGNYLAYGIPLLLFVYVWLELIFTNQNRLVPPLEGSKFATYYLPDSVLILTIVIPSLLTWVLGLLTVILFRSYYKNVKGILYRVALSSMVQGIIGVILGSVFLQALLSMGPRRLIDLGLGTILILIYLFLLIQAAGFLLIARGANKLTKIESV